jgi:hypothetical protein
VSCAVAGRDWWWCWWFGNRTVDASRALISVFTPHP